MADNKETREVEILLNAQQANASIKEMAAGVGLMNNQLAKMSQDDPRREQLQRDFQVLTQRVGAARAEMRTYVQTEEELRVATEKLNQENLTVILNGQKLNSSFREMKDSAALLEKQLEEMNGDAPGRQKMLADYHALQDRIEGVKSEMKGATEGTSYLKQGFANAFAFFTGGGIIDLAQKLFGFFASAREEFQGSAKSSADLEATLWATKNAAGLTADEIRKIGEERSKVTLFDDDETNRASAMLLTFKNVKKGVFEDAIPAIQDLATKMAGDGPADMKGASIQLGKALNDPIKGITALTRVGVTFTDQQKEQIAQMVKMGNTAGAQKLILAELNSEFGGSAEAARKAGGGMATLSMRWNEMKETVGSFVSEGLTTLSDWLGRVLDRSQPLVDVFVEIGTEIGNFYGEIADVVQGMGLFTSGTDTASAAATILTTVVTLLLAPFRLLIQVEKAVVEGFTTLYNKSELLRGVLGGLGAVISSVFMTIKDDAIKILGGVGDIILGIFTLDKSKIIAGFKSALAATADVMLEGGNKAADAFAKGYEANKNNKIVRRVSVETKETTTKAGGTAAANGEEPAGETAAAAKSREAAEKKAKAARNKADQERLNDLKKWVKEEGDLLDGRNALADQRDKVELTRQGQQRQAQEDKVFESAKSKLDKLSGLESDYTVQVAAILTDRDTQLQALQATWAERDEAERQKQLDEQIKLNEADTQEKLAYLELQLADKLLGQQGYEEMVFQVKQASKDRELAMLKQKNGQESAEYKKLNAEKIKEQADHAKKAKASDDDYAKFKKGLASVDKVLNNDNVVALEESLGKQTIAYKAFKIARKADAIANIGVALWAEVQDYWKTAAGMGPIAGPIYGVAMSGLAVVRQGIAAAKIAGFAKGGATGDGMMMPRSAAPGLMDMLQAATGLGVASNGRLTDASGLEVAGIVHKNEYVIPAWMREDPQVLQVENWLETRRQRGFYEGGPTTQGDTRAQTLPAAPADQVNTTQQLVQVLSSLDQRLQGVEQWATQLEVVNDLLGMDRDLAKLKKVQNKSSIK